MKSLKFSETNTSTFNQDFISELSLIPEVISEFSDYVIRALAIMQINQVNKKHGRPWEALSRSGCLRDPITAEKCPFCRPFNGNLGYRILPGRRGDNVYRENGLIIYVCA